MYAKTSFGLHIFVLHSGRCYSSLVREFIFRQLNPMGHDSWRILARQNVADMDQQLSNISRSILLDESRSLSNVSRSILQESLSLLA